MPNTSNHSPDADQQSFIDEIAALLGPWGMQPSQARLYAYLLMSPEPVGLDAIAVTLGMAKSSASVAARTLENFGLVRRYGEIGSKRVRYGATENFSGYIAAQASLMGEVGRLVEARARDVVTGDTLRRLRYFGAFYRKMDKAITDRIRELTDDYVRSGPDEDLK